LAILQIERIKIMKRDGEKEPFLTAIHIEALKEMRNGRGTNTEMIDMSSDSEDS